MYKNILVPVASDHDPKTDRAVGVARLLKDGGGKITVLTVVEALPEFILTQLPAGQLEKNRKEMEAGLAEDFNEADDVEIVVISGHAGRTIVDYAQEQGIDCIVMNSHRPDLSDYFLGSTAARVVRHAQCAVHVLR
ncbi:universal stress protein [Shimia aestuarii]|uniref:Nucleotide-binding universal stress protein, UspA family n=1 Tax=Shimia aestuarii TaxID=254406 RepID=A0A1I4RY87_9RHOB|nr:universal stress protein [Shimia aestuarii]SFM56950.1 Nucleotide-binding universal stress protein, UspA family [Shimia aestuarii]